MSKSTSFRLPDATVAQIARGARAAGMTQTQYVIVAIDRMARGSQPGARKPGEEEKNDSSILS